ncbi:MAG: tryptophan--tRNA ligase [Candidatus Pacebacteria bacterium]|nr:tryptophan--tRNA ligase [Candidatus Paceibacterota bacterium]
MNERPVLMSGIKPSGELHIGNYFGAMRQQVDLFKSGDYQCFIMVADYHALNTIQDADEMRQRTIELATAYVAVGLDPEQVVLFKQSDVPAHTELTWIFDAITTMPYLMRAHAFKDAEAKNHEITVGTFNYPMLMAADILLYDTTIVPVGQDQKQHIEYARDTAEKFNRIFAKEDKGTFVLPKEHIMPDVAIVPGTDGQKMSKSYGNVIPLFAPRDVIAEKVMGIVTDSSGDRPENVYAIHKLLKTEDELAPLYEEHKGKYKALKEALIDDLDAFIAPMRTRYEALQKDPSTVLKALETGKEKAREVSEAKMQQVRKAIGVVF